MADDVLRITKADASQGLVIAGDIDEYTYLTLTQSIAALAPNGDVHIDLGGVEFCDVAGLRAIVGAAGPASEARPDRHVILHAVPARVLRILAILGWDEMPAVAFDDESLAVRAC